MQIISRELRCYNTLRVKYNYSKIVSYQMRFVGLQFSNDSYFNVSNFPTSSHKWLHKTPPLLWLAPWAHSSSATASVHALLVTLDLEKVTVAQEVEVVSQRCEPLTVNPSQSNWLFQLPFLSFGNGHGYWSSENKSIETIP